MTSPPKWILGKYNRMQQTNTPRTMRCMSGQTIEKQKVLYEKFYL